MKRYLLIIFSLCINFPILIGQTTITASADTTICIAGTASLSAVVTGGGFGTDSYTFEVFNYSPEAYTGGTTVTFAGNQDDQIAGPFEIGFEFCFFNQIYSSFCIGTNGWVGFTYPPPPGQNWNTFTSQAIPSTDPAVPKNCIMAPWEDWYPNYYPLERNVAYYTTGIAPNRKLVVYWLDCPMYGCYTTRGTFQIVLDETTSVIENHITNKPYCSSSGGTATQGVHRLDGLVAFTATGRNSTVWTTTNESTRFVPSGIKWYVGGYPGGTIVGYGPTLTASPVTTTTYTVVVETCGTGTATDVVTVTVVDPAFNYLSNTYCNSDGNTAPIVAQTGGVFSSTPPGLVFFSTVTGEIDIAASAPGVYTITHTMTGICTATVSHLLTIIAIPDAPVAITPFVSRCGPGDVTFSVAPMPGNNILWYNSPTGGTAYPFTGTTITTSIAATTSFYAEAVSQTNNCPGLTRTEITATVKPIPAISNSVLTSIQCSGVATNILLLSSVNNSSFSWTAASGSPDISGYFNDSGTSIVQTLQNTGYTSGTVTYTVVPHADGCDGPPVDFTVNVKPLPDVIFTQGTIFICSGQGTNISLNSHVLNADFTWTATPSSPQVTGWTNNSTPTTTINDLLINSGFNIETVTYHITPHANGCDGPVTDYVVSVYPTPDLSNNPKSKSQCNNLSTNITLNSDVSGTLFTWTATPSSAQITGWNNNITPSVTINDLLVNSGFNFETITYHITPHANGCDGIVTDYVVTVYPTPNLSNSPAAKQICNNTSTNVTLTSNVSGSQFTWTATPSSAQVTGWNDNNTPSVTINDLLVNSGFSIETVTYHVTPHANGCDGPVTDYVVTVYPTPDLSNNPKNKSQCNNLATGISLTSNISGTLFTWTASPSSAQVTGWNNNITPSVNINDLLVNAGFNIETVTYHITPHANGCDGIVTDFVVTVYPTPDLSNNPKSKSQCNNLATGISLTSNVSGTLFTWTATPSSAQVTGWNNNITPSTTINDLLVNSGSNIETVTYHITPLANGCSGAVTDYVVTVYPTPDLSNNPKSKSQCNNLATGITLTSNVTGSQFTWTATPSSAQVTGWNNNNTPSVTINDLLINSGYNIETVTYHITPLANGCSGAVTDYMVTVYPTPDLSNNPKSKSQCNNLATNITLNSNVSGTLFTWTAAPSSAQVTGWNNNITPSVTINDLLINSGFTIETVTYHITPHANGCAGTVTDYVVTVYPTPNLSNSPAAKQICNNTSTNVTLTSNVSGSLFTWTATPSSAQVTGWNNNITPSVTINDLLVNSGFSIETVTYHITPRANGCDGPVTDYVVTVYPTPDLSNNPKNKSQCNNLAAGISLTSNISGTLFTWTASPSSAQVTGWNNNITPSVAINDLLVNSGFNIETVTYHITPHANGCDGVVTDFVVTVYPTPLLTTSPLAQTICTNSPILVNLTSTVSGSSFTWTCTPSSPNLSGYTNGNTNQISQTLSNSGFTIETVTYHIIPAANSCSGPMTDYVVTVNPKPDVSNSPLSNQICSGTSPMINLTSNVANANFSWTATPSSAFVTGYSPGSGLLINQVLTNTGFNIETVTYHITPTANACTGNTVDFVVTIVSVPDVYFSPAAQTICSASFTNIQVLSHVVGATFSWTALPSSPNITGFFNDAGNLIAQPLLNSGNTIENVTYTVTPAAFGCPVGIPQNVVATVNPKPAITNTVRTQQTCSSQNVSITPLSTVTGSSYSWVASGSSPNVTGFSNGSGLSLTHTLVNSGFNIETVTYVITPTANSCPGDTAHFQVIVFPVADVYFTPATQSICPMQSTNVSINSHVALTTFTWTATGTSLASGYFPDAGSVIQQVLNNTGYNIETVTYHVTPLANGCTGSNNNLIVSVDPSPVVTFTSCHDPVTTTNAKPVKLKGGIPLNGVYSGTGVTGTTFFPAIAGSGTFAIEYIYTNQFGCKDTASQSITVIAPVTFTCGSDYTDQRDNKTYPTVQIFTQCWMAANLDYGNYISATVGQRDNCSPEKYCYNDNPGNCSSYGGLYQWDELMKYDNFTGIQGLCPPAWHIPDETEWNILFNSFTSNGFAGSPLKYTGFSGFNAFLDGVKFHNLNWYFLDFATLFWSSSSHNTYKAWAHGLNSYNPSVSFYPSSRSNSFPVRCIKD